MTVYTQCQACGRLLAPKQMHSTEACLRNQAIGVVEMVETEDKTSTGPDHRLELWREQHRANDLWMGKQMLTAVKVEPEPPLGAWSSPEAEQGNVGVNDVIVTPTPKRTRRRDEIVDFGNIPYDVVIAVRCNCGHTLEQHHQDSKACLEDCVCMAYEGFNE